MNSKEMRVLLDVMEQVSKCTEWDEDLRDLICARLRHCQYTTVNEIKLFDVNLPLSERVGAFLTNKHDWLLGTTIAHQYGFLVSEGMENYDPRYFLWEMGVPLARERLYRYLRGLGCRPSPTLSQIAADGISHYNIYSLARTPVGQMASNFESGPKGGFDTPHGKFNTLEGYYHILRVIDFAVATEGDDYPMWQHDNEIARDITILQTYSTPFKEIDELFMLDGASCIRVGRELKRKLYGGTNYRPGAFSAHAERCFMTAVVRKLHVLQYDGRCLGNVLAEIVQQRVPLDHYYVMQGRVIRPKHAEWLPNLITRIVEHIDPYASTFDPDEVITLLE